MFLSVLTEIIFIPKIETSISSEQVNRDNQENERHLRFAKEPKQSTKGHRQLPGNAIPITAGRVEHESHLTRVTVFSAPVRQGFPTMFSRFIPICPGISIDA